MCTSCLPHVLQIMQIHASTETLQRCRQASQFAALEHMSKELEQNPSPCERRFAKRFGAGSRRTWRAPSSEPSLRRPGRRRAQLYRGPGPRDSLLWSWSSGFHAAALRRAQLLRLPLSSDGGMTRSGEKLGHIERGGLEYASSLAMKHACSRVLFVHSGVCFLAWLELCRVQ